MLPWEYRKQYGRGAILEVAARTGLHYNTIRRHFKKPKSPSKRLRMFPETADLIEMGTFGKVTADECLYGRVRPRRGEP